MSLAGREDIIDKRFGPEFAGHRVGRVQTTTKELDDGEMLVNIDVATALVGTDGAEVSHVVLEDGQEVFHSTSTNGFGVASAVSLTALRGDTDIHPTQWHLLSSRMYSQSFDKRPEAARILRNGADSIHEGHLLDITWFNTPAEGLAALRFALDFGELDGHFDQFYFTLNQGLLHTALRPDDYDRLYLNSGYYDNAMADPAMHEKTEEELKKATGVNARLAEQFTNNLQMQEWLEDNEPQNVTQEFIGMRREAHQKEQELGRLAGIMSEAGAVYLPVDFGRGRSWPYMDAACADEDQAFGLELKALRAGHAGKAAYELDREHSDLGMRLEYAIQGRRALNILSRLETRLADEA